MSILTWLHKHRDYLTAILIGFGLTFFFVWFETNSSSQVSAVKNRLEYFVYDLRLNIFSNEQLQEKSSVAIVDIDEKSLAQYGRWPWSREKLITLINKLQANGVILIAFDIIFAEPEKNLFEEISQKNPLLFKKFDLDQLNQLKEQFDMDIQFSHFLKNGEFVLSFILKNIAEQNIGNLPPPYLSLSDDVLNLLKIPIAKSYTANIQLLQDQVPYTGFISVIPDEDGNIRKVPLLLRYKNNVYASLALQAVTNFLLINNPELILTKSSNYTFLEGIKLADTMIPTDSLARMLIPYQGNPRTITTFSAADILTDKIDKSALENKLIFIGTSALGLGDLKATPVSVAFPGTEIQATIANAILNKKFIQSPDWLKGSYVILLIFLGSLLSLVLPKISSMKNIFITLFLLSSIIFINFMLWKFYLISLQLVNLILMILSISIFNEIFAYFIERKSKLKITAMFEQYVPPEHIKNLIKQSETLNLGGETRTMTVLFSDIVSFTTISEKLAPAIVTAMLNFYLSNMSEIIFKYNGTIDKYVGDMIMAFWNAPLKDNLHVYHAMQAAIAMQKKLVGLKNSFESQGFPHFKTGIGIHSGDMLVGDMGSTYRRNYTVLGDAVNLASRLEALTRIYGVDIIISEICIQHAPDLYYRKLDTITVKGKTQPVTIYELIVTPEDKEVLEKIKDEIKLFETMLKFYFAQNWIEMEKCLLELLKLNPHKKLYQIYNERLQTLKHHPFNPEWNGVFQFKEK